MSWQDYVDNQLIASQCVSKACIAGHDGGVWAKSDGFEVSDDATWKIFLKRRRRKKKSRRFHFSSFSLLVSNLVDYARHYRLASGSVDAYFESRDAEGSRKALKNPSNVTTFSHITSPTGCVWFGKISWQSKAFLTHQSALYSLSSFILP